MRAVSAILLLLIAVVLESQAEVIILGSEKRGKKVFFPSECPFQLDPVVVRELESNTLTPATTRGRRTDTEEFRAFLDVKFAERGLWELTEGAVSLRMSLLWVCMSVVFQFEKRPIEASARQCLMDDQQAVGNFHCGSAGAFCMQRVDWRTHLFQRFIQNYTQSRGDVTLRFAERKDMWVGRGLLGDPDRYLDVLNLLYDMYTLPEAAQVVLPEPGWWAAVAALSLLFLALVAILVTGALRRFWLDKTLLCVCLLVASFGTASQLLVCAFRSTGYQNLFWDASRAAPVPRVAVDLLERLSMVAVMLVVLALFAWTILDALVETFFSDCRTAIRVIGISLVAATLISTVYACAMAVITAVAPSDFFVVDVAPLLIPLLSFLYASFLLGLLIFVSRVVNERKQHDANYLEAKRNVTIFMAVASVLLVILLAYMLLTFLYYFGLVQTSRTTIWGGETFSQFRLPYQILGTLSVFSIVLSLFAYVAQPILRGFSEERSFSETVQGYAQVSDTEDHIPLQYEI